MRELIKDLESQRPSSIIDIIHSGERMQINESVSRQQIKQKCSQCGFMSSNKICKACTLLTQLSKLKAKRSIEYEDSIIVRDYKIKINI